MTAQILATRPGGLWPAPGEELEVGDQEGAELVAAELAVPVVEKRPPIKRSQRTKAV